MDLLYLQQKYPKMVCVHLPNIKTSCYAELHNALDPEKNCLNSGFRIIVYKMHKTLKTTEPDDDNESIKLALTVSITTLKQFKK